MADAAYGAAGNAAAGHFTASLLTRGPWHPDHQHGGPPIALVCRAIEQAAQAQGLTHMARLTANLVRPVPIGDVQVQVHAAYVGRNAGHFSALLLADGKEVGMFTALAQREIAVDLPDGLPGHPLPTAPQPPGACPPARFPFAGQYVGYAELVETRVARGQMFNGPCAVWFRLRHPLVAGASPSAYQRVAVASDSSNRLSGVLDYRRYRFVNSDLRIPLPAPPLCQ